MKFKYWLCDEMNKRGYIQETLADEIHVSSRTIRWWLSGKKTPNVANIEKILVLFGLENVCRLSGDEIIEINVNDIRQQCADLNSNVSVREFLEMNDNVVEQKNEPEHSDEIVTRKRYVHDSLTVISVILLILGVLKLWDKHWIVGATSSILSIALFFFGHKMEKFIVIDLNRSRMVCLMAFVYLLEFLQFVCRLKGITESELFFSIVILACMLAVLALVAFEVFKVLLGMIHACHSKGA